MRIFLIGQCTLHWGRMEYGNIGNYYIIEPFVRELHRVFLNANVVTTFQLSDDFCKKEKIECVPMDCYYGWNDDDLDKSYKEIALATLYHESGKLIESTPFIDEVLKSDLVIDFSGDIWGANADLVGKNRFLVGLLKDKVVQLLGKPIALLAGSPGPFNGDNTFELAKNVFSNFNLVTNREPISRDVLTSFGFKTSHVVDVACPAFLFESKSDKEIEPIIQRTPIFNSDKPIVGFILCGWNMTHPPFSKWPRDDKEYALFVETIEYMVKEFGVKVCLMSHSNGFELPPNFKPIQGRDFPIARQLAEIISGQDYSKEVFLFEELCSPAEIKAVIRQFDMLVSGRIHGAVAGLSQNVPTVIIDYGHEPKAHKSKGFARVAGVEDLVADPADLEDMKSKAKKCWINRSIIRTELSERIPAVQQKARLNFDLLKKVAN